MGQRWLWTPLQMTSDIISLLLLLDFSAAFDMVNHNLLAHCLTDTGILGTVLQWLVSSLQDWGQKVAFEEKTSPRQSLVFGIPQGVILSLMLFNIYTHPLSQLVWSFRLGCHQYVDDIQLNLLITLCS